ncbi:sugar-binding domain-containing protein [uncultured Bacteroides sp.]|uniref:sugar-binding domain-containing protein n=1 Tax=uncultured Bacteroides sp. TaxID=162156 RepID=UPI0037478BFD
MKTQNLISQSAFALVMLLSVSCYSMTSRVLSSFNKNWTFHLGDVPEAFSPGFEDSLWRRVNLPHDWAIEGKFSKDNPSGCGGGALPGGVGWYRKSFKLKPEAKGKKVFVDFDGVYMDSEVWINGHYLGKRPYGYISFRYDLTHFIKFGQKNVIAVRVDNNEQPNSRWYSGCGIYRNVWLTIADPVHVDQWGTFVTTPKVSKEKATVALVTKVKNDSKAEVTAELRSLILNSKGVVVAKSVSAVKITAGKTQQIKQSIDLSQPELWTLENPYLYKIVSVVSVGGKVVDQYETPLGIRGFTFDVQKGFILNGVPTKIKGVCMHHDLGCLGAAVNVRAIERQLEILKSMGCNGIRCSHNPPAPELLNLCDRMGFVVMDESFDMWRKKKTAHDYSRYFNEWHERDLTDHILRDRNHPSVFMWSIGNEVLEQWTDASADTLDLQAANLLLNFKRDPKILTQKGDSMSVNSMLTLKLADMVKALDSTRPVTSGCNEPDPNNHLFRSKALDLIGFNYHETYFKDVCKNFPGKPFIVTESTSALMTRGYYRAPSDSMYIWPVRWDIPFRDDSYSCSSYDNCHVPWGTTHEDSWRIVKNNDFISGMYIWTGFDYLGEPTPYDWPARSSYFGIVDLAGFPKDVYYMYQSEWTDKDVLHVFPHWSWKAGETVDVWAYYNHADEVELFLNGKSQGVKTKGKDDFHVMWRLKFVSGTIRVVSRKAGKVVLAKEIKTAGAPAKIKLTADRNVITADGKDLSFVTVEVRDKDGNLCPNADNLIHFNLQGEGKIVGVDNGSPISEESFKANFRKAFYGKCLVVIQSGVNRGTVSLKATSEDLKSNELLIKISK